MEIKLQLQLDEINAIVATLAQLPFSQVHELVNKIRGQAIEQIQAAQAPEAGQTAEQREGSAE